MTTLHNEVSADQYTILSSDGSSKGYFSVSNDDIALDSQWVKTAFMLTKDGATDATDLANRYWSSAGGKFTDGRFGCNIGINCHPQFTPYADIPEPGRLSGRVPVSLNETSGNYGMGGFWSTAFDDPEQIIYMRFGVPEFNSLFAFFTRAFNHGASVLARTGRWPSFLYTTAEFLGRFAVLTAFPLIAVPLLIYEVADFFLFRKSARFYHMKPTMHLYWSSVNMLVNTLALNSGIYPKIMGANNDYASKIGMPFKLDQETMGIYHELAPDLFTKENYIDVFALANRAQRLANQLLADEYAALNQGTATDFTGYLKRNMTGDGTHSTKVSDKQGEVTFETMVNKFFEFGEYHDAPLDTVIIESDLRTGRNDEKKKETYDPLYSDGSLENFKKHLSAEFRMGGQFAVMRVTHTGSQSESFSNNVQSSALEGKLNSISSNFAEHRFTLGNGAALGSIVQGALGLATDVLMGALNGVTFGLADGIKGLMGEGYVDIPKHWQSSGVTLPRAQYKMVLTAPYGNVLTRIMRLFVPFCMIAAGAWPRSTGRQSYTGPFLCQLYDAGRVQIPLGMITEFSVSRGTGNLGFNLKNQPLSMELSFTVTDLSSILHMPLTTGVLGVENTMLDEESTITNYLATVAGQTVYNQVYPATRAKIRAAKVAMNIGLLSSPAFWASTTHDLATDSILKYLVVGPLIEAGSRGSELVQGNNI